MRPGEGFAMFRWTALYWPGVGRECTRNVNRSLLVDWDYLRAPFWGISHHLPTMRLRK